MKKIILGNFLLIRHTEELENSIGVNGVSQSLIDENVSTTMLHGLQVIRVSSCLISDKETFGIKDGDIITVRRHGITKNDLIIFNDIKFYLVRIEHVVAKIGEMDKEELKSIQENIDIK